jgi:hypothetical protein
MARHRRNRSRRVAFARRDSESGFDFIRARIEPQLPIVLSMSDGHGSPKCFRSDRGSRFAVKKAAVSVSEFLDERRGKFDLSEIESKKDYLSKEFVKRWREAVEADLKKEPFTEKNLKISKKNPMRSAKTRRRKSASRLRRNFFDRRRRRRFYSLFAARRRRYFERFGSGRSDKPLCRRPASARQRNDFAVFAESGKGFSFFRAENFRRRISGDDFAFDRRLSEFLFERSRIFPSRNRYFANARD